MRFGVCGRLVDALADALAEISRTDSDGLDEQRRRTIPQVVKGTQIDEGVLAGVAKQAVDEHCNDITVGLRECRAHSGTPTLYAAVRPSRMTTVVGQPNLVAILSRKSASRRPSHWRKAAHASHVIDRKSTRLNSSHLG